MNNYQLFKKEFDPWSQCYFCTLFIGRRFLPFFLYTLIVPF